MSVDDIQVGLAMAYADQGKTLAGRLDLLGAGIRDHTFRSAVETAATGVETAMQALDELITADGRFT